MSHRRRIRINDFKVEKAKEVTGLSDTGVFLNVFTKGEQWLDEVAAAKDAGELNKLLQ